MAKLVKHSQKCPSCDGRHSYAKYDDNSGYCFKCGGYFVDDIPLDEYRRMKREETDKNRAPRKRASKMNKKTSPEVARVEEEKTDTSVSSKRVELANNAPLAGPWPERKLDKSLKHFGVKDVGKGWIAVPLFGPDRELCGYRFRSKYHKRFLTEKITDAPPLVGLDKVKEGGHKIVLTEAPEDAMSVYEALVQKRDNPFIQVVGLQSCSNMKSVLENRDMFRSFKEVIIWMDNDEAGNRARDEIIKIIGLDKARVVPVTRHKDASDVLVHEGPDQVIDLIYRASTPKISGVVDAVSVIDRVIESRDTQFIEWPAHLKGLNNMTRGRALGSITLLAAGTGVGKSTFIREDIYHILRNTSFKVGICALEESVEDTVVGLLSIHMGKRLTDPKVRREVSIEEEKRAFEDLFTEGRALFYDHQGDIGETSLLDRIEYMAASGCKMIYLDHITIAVSEFDTTDINAATDRLMAALLRIVQTHKVWIMVVSHLRKTSKAGDESFETGAVPSEDDLKGSGALKQISYQTIALSRNKMADTTEEREKTKVWVLKDRKIGRTGFAGEIRFNDTTGRAEEV